MTLSEIRAFRKTFINPSRRVGAGEVTLDQKEENDPNFHKEKIDDLKSKMKKYEDEGATYMITGHMKDALARHEKRYSELNKNK